MKVLFINIADDGHHLYYIKALTAIVGIEIHVILHKNFQELKCQQHIISNIKFGSNKFIDHYKWCKKVKKIVKLIKPDIIHFVYGDSFYRFFGIGLFWLKKYKSIITFHQVKQKLSYKISIKIYSNIFSKIIVHTHFLYNYLLTNKIKNVIEINYPNFHTFEKQTKENAKKFLNIKTNKPIILALGGTRYDKGLDILLTALNFVKNPFHLLIAGPEQYISFKDINAKIKNYNNDVTIILKYLNDKEINACYSACDYVVLPYRKIFEGASGPLTEGVAFSKEIIGPSHGSIGQIIMENHIGKTFLAEDIDNLAQTIDEALAKQFVYDENAKNYQNNLTVSKFQSKHKNIYYELLAK